MMGRVDWGRGNLCSTSNMFEVHVSYVLRTPNTNFDLLVVNPRPTSTSSPPSTPEGLS